MEQQEASHNSEWTARGWIEIKFVLKLEILKNMDSNYRLSKMCKIILILINMY